VIQSPWKATIRSPWEATLGKERWPTGEHGGDIERVNLLDMLPQASATTTRGAWPVACAFSVLLLFVPVLAVSVLSIPVLSVAVMATP